MKRACFAVMMVLAFTVVSLFPATGLHAKDAAPDQGVGIGISVKAGTLGLGGDLTVGIIPNIGLRFGINGMTLNSSASGNDGQVYSDLEWLTYGGFFDFYPAGGGFRFTAGMMKNKNKVVLNADLAEPVSLNSQEFPLTDLQGTITFKETAPYLGIGYGNAVDPDGRLHFVCDFGVMFQGEPKADASAVAANAFQQSIVDAELDNEVADIQDELNAFKYYPVVSLGFSFRF